jgi:2-polyprenyl-3-methyl-5-hydroxy-6-metoxy-1,4-benzoquinol methylase
MEMNQPDNERYWVKRHETLRGSLSAVGKIGTPEQENRQKYALKKRKVASLLRYFGRLDLDGTTVLDVGCGIGMLSELFFSLGADVSGVDPSPIAIAEARDRAGPPPQSPDNFKIGSIVSFNFEKQFDFTFCLDVLYHVVDDRNWETAVKNLVKHTKTGGYLVLSEKTQTAPQRPAEHVRFRTKAMYDDVLNGLGLRDFAPEEYGDLMVYRLRKRSLSGLAVSWLIRNRLRSSGSGP